MLSGKNIIITGAASGIGAATARIVKELGGTVIAFDRNEPADNADEYFQVDLADELSIDLAFDKYRGKADALCNIAGVPPTVPPELLLRVNFLGLRHFTEKLIDKLKPGASIVNMASMAGSGWRENLNKVQACLALTSLDQAEAFCQEHDIVPENSYFFSKEALLVWSMLSWDRWADRDIRINAVSPGPIETPILSDFVSMMGDKADEDLERIGAGSSEDIAPVVAFLCSDGSKWIKGANIRADGGLFASVSADMIRGQSSAWG